MFGSVCILVLTCGPDHQANHPHSIGIPCDPLRNSYHPLWSGVGAFLDRYDPYWAGLIVSGYLLTFSSRLDQRRRKADLCRQHHRQHFGRTLRYHG